MLRRGDRSAPDPARPGRRGPRLRPDRPGTGQRPGGRGLPHRPSGRGRRGPGAHRDRLAGPGGRAVLPGHGPQPDGTGAAAALRHEGPPAARHRGRALRRGPPRGHRRERRGPVGLLHAARRSGDAPHRPAGRHRRHDPGRAGRDHPLAAGRRPRGPGWPWDGQDGGRPAPRRLPALHLPLPARGPGSPGGRAEPGVPPLHRAGAAVARRGRGGARRARRSRARRHVRRRRCEGTRPG